MLEIIPKITESTQIGPRCESQKRAVIAGIIIIPIDNNVPSDWKPPTKLNTISLSNNMCIYFPNGENDLKNKGSRLSITKARQKMHRLLTVIIVIAAMSQRVCASIANIEPNKRWSRSIIDPLSEIIMMPAASAIR